MPGSLQTFHRLRVTCIMAYLMSMDGHLWRCSQSVRYGFLALMRRDTLWVHSSGLESRIDFLAVGGHVDGATTRSNRRLLTVNQDHWGVCMSLHAVFRHGCLGGALLKKRRVDRFKIMSTEGRRLLKEAVAGLPQQDWTLHPPDMHAHALEEQLNGGTPLLSRKEVQEPASLASRFGE